MDDKQLTYTEKVLVRGKEINNTSRQVKIVTIKNEKDTSVILHQVELKFATSRFFHVRLVKFKKSDLILTHAPEKLILHSKTLETFTFDKSESIELEVMGLNLEKNWEFTETKAATPLTNLMSLKPPSVRLEVSELRGTISTDKNPFFVPIDLQAFWNIDQKTMQEQLSNTRLRMHRWPIEFASGVRYGLSPEPLPFNSEESLSSGIVLRWELPKGLLHGTPNGNKIVFPFLPNRWLITRFAVINESVTSSAWLVESDVESELGISLIRDGELVRIGKKTKLTDVPNQSSQNKTPSLTTIMNGTISFTAFEPYHTNVFSIHDDLEGMEKGTISYFVAGWYSDQLIDPLSENQTTIAEKLATLGLKLKSVPSSLENSCLVCHGGLYGIKWEKTKEFQVPHDSLKDSAKEQFAVGQTPMDALSSLIKRAPFSAIPSNLLFAFQSGLFDQLGRKDDEWQLQQEKHQRDFNSESGGTRWTLVSKLKRESSNGDDSVFPQNLETLKNLNSLNRIQRSLDYLNRKLAHHQWELYAAWSMQLVGQLTKEKWHARKDSLKTEIESINKIITKLKEDSNAPNSTLQADKDWELKAVPADPFWFPSDPTLLITGVKSPWTQKKEDGLVCRLLGEILTKRTLQKPDALLELAFDDVLSPEQRNTLTKILESPLKIGDLLQEFVLSNPDFSPQMKKAFKEKDDTLTDEMLSVLDKVPTSASDNSAVVPLKIWSQPWTPIFLQWQILWCPIPYDQWSLDLTEDNSYKVKPETTINIGASYYGRTLLAPNATYGFRRRIKELMEAQVDLTNDLNKQTLSNLLETVRGWDLLDQSIGGFHAALVQRDTRLRPAPNETDEIALLLNKQSHHPPLTDLRAYQFQPIRQGIFFIEALNVVDTFGLSVDFVIADNLVDKTRAFSVCDAYQPSWKLGGSDGPKYDTALADQKSATVVVLPPRIVQPTRLYGEWISADEDKHLLTEHAESTPILGWMLVNSLEKALQFYTASGEALGELRENDGQWRPAPGSEINPTQIKGRLQQVVKPLLGKEKLIKGWFNLFDRAFSKLERGQSEDTHLLHALVGRPLAIVRSGWMIELADPPYRDQGPSNREAEWETKYQFEVRLGKATHGKDGFLGYFGGVADSEYTKFMSPYQPVEAEGYFEQNQSLRLNPSYPRYDTNGLVPKLTYRTLLVDPFYQIHAYTPILPIITLKLPRYIFQPALNQMSIYAKIGPLLTYHIVPTSSPNKDTVPSIVMPIPAVGIRKFGWPMLSEGKTTFNTCDILATLSAEQASQSSPEIVEGMLLLSGKKEIQPENGGRPNRPFPGSFFIRNATMPNPDSEPNTTPASSMVSQ